METRNEQCGQCVYYAQSDPGRGDCRRYAPQPNPCFFVSRSEATGTIKTDVHWPKVYESNWCGEFKAR